MVNDAEAAEIQIALERFTVVGRSLRSKPEVFETSVAKQLQNCFVSFDAEVAGIIGQRKVDNQSGYNSSTAFVALAAPSLVGKTQLAFTFDDSVLITMYFPLRYIQEVYKNFWHWREALMRAVRADFKKLKKKSPSTFD